MSCVSRDAQAVGVTFQPLPVVAVDRIPASYALTRGGHLDGVAGEAVVKDVGILIMEAVLEATEHCLDPARHRFIGAVGHPRGPHPVSFASPDFNSTRTTLPHTV
jgi:hypothetical protein